MYCKGLFLVLCLVVGLGGPTVAQHAELDGLTVKPSGEAYLRSIRFRGINPDVGYFDPTRPAPPLETTQELRRDSEARREGPDLETTFTWGRTTTLLITSMIILGTVYLFILFGGQLPVSFSRNPDAGGDGARRRAAPAEGGPQMPLGIEAVLRMTDRRAALVALCKSLLARAVAAEGVLLQDSWTDRDTLRRVPRSLPERDALQDLVFASERVQFGGRDVTEEEFKAHVTRLRPLLTGAGAA